MEDLAEVEEFASLAALSVAHSVSLARLEDKARQLDEARASLERRLDESEVEIAGLRARSKTATPGHEEEFYGIVSKSASMRDVFRLVERVARTDMPVVITGESGTGKELVARALHAASPRRSGPFVAENCGAVPETLLESILFGHAKGAFTGAHAASPGLFEAADGGVIFLDEIGEMSPAMQAKLLRVLQEGEVRRVGEQRVRAVSTRVLAATHRDLEAMVEAGTFRQDLYYRLCVVRLELPPLRARREDISLLVSHFLKRYDAEGLTVSAAASRRLVHYPWPGNVRELENEVQRWIALCENAVTPRDLSPHIEGHGEGHGLDPDDLRIRAHTEHLERTLIERALDRTDGNLTHAAKLLGLSRYGLQKKIKRLDELVRDGAEGAL
jgi:DNA-binding NtrC family response regulator